MSAFSYREREAADRGYRVADDGSAFSRRMKLKPFPNSLGRLFISIRSAGGKCSVHRLAAFQKWGEKIYTEGLEVRHLDGNPTNNAISNLALGTHSENMLDIPVEKRVATATRASHVARRHDKQAVQDFYATCRSYSKTMKRFGISSKGTLHWLLNTPIVIPITRVLPGVIQETRETTLFHPRTYLDARTGKLRNHHP